MISTVTERAHFLRLDDNGFNLERGGTHGLTGSELSTALGLTRWGRLALWTMSDCRHCPLNRGALFSLNAFTAST